MKVTYPSLLGPRVSKIAMDPRIYPGQFFIGATLFPVVSTLNGKKKVSPKINLFGLCENAWLPWQSLMLFLRMRVYLKINQILAVTYHRLLNLVPN